MGTRRWSTRALFALWVTCLAFVGGLPAASPLASPVQAQAAGTGSISGTVTNDGGTPLAGIEVSVQGGDLWRQMVTDGNGHYEFTDLPAEEYVVSFADPARVYASEYYDSTTSWRNVTWLDLADGAALTGIDATLDVGGRITGTVLDEAGNPFARTRVCAVDINVGGATPCADGNADGTYDVGGVGAGSYTVFLDTWEADGTFRSLLYPGVHEFSDIIEVPVVLGQTSGGIDFLIDRTAYGTLSGEMLDENGQPFDDAYVCAEGPTAECVDPAADGSYKLGLLPGEYRVSFNLRDGPGKYYDGTTGGTGDWDDALLVTVTAGVATTDIDAVFDMSAYGTISGTVLRQDGTSFAWAGVCVEEGPTWACTDVDDDGSYLLQFLEPGDYLVRFEVAPEGFEYYDGVGDPDLATRVTVVSGGSVTGIDARFPELGYVEGQITGPGGSPVEGALVGLVGPDDTWFPSHLTETNPNGYYTHRDVPTGHYRVVIVPPAGSGLTSSWHTAGDGSIATIEVRNESWERVDRELAAAGTITGTLTDPDGNPTPGVEVRLRVPGSLWATATTTTDANGEYAFGDVSPGDYQVRYLVADESPVAGGWYDAADANAGAETITVVSGGAMTLDQVLRWSRSLSGTVTGPGSAPVQGAVVRAYRSTDGFVPTTRTETAADGSYSLSNLPRGEYRIQVTPLGGSGLRTSWLGGTNRSTAEPVAIGDADHTVVDMELAQG